MTRTIRTFLAAVCFCLMPLTAHALEGDWEIGGNAETILMYSRDIYGGGGKFFARYSVLDGFSLGASAGFYGAQDTDIKKSLGIYTLSLDMIYALDILAWVPGAGISLSSLFSENKVWKWHNKGHGLSLDFDVFVQYRGIRHLGIGIFFSYHLVFVDADYITVGLGISWFSGMF